MISERKYACSFCGKAFLRSEHKSRHERSHTGIKPFRCSICTYSFVRRDLLQRHIRTVHKDKIIKLSNKNISASTLLNSLIEVNETTLSKQSVNLLPFITDGKKETSSDINCGSFISLLVNCNEKIRDVSMIYTLFTYDFRLKYNLTDERINNLLESSLQFLFQETYMQNLILNEFSQICTNDINPILLISMLCLGAFLLKGQSLYILNLWQESWNIYIKTHHQNITSLIILFTMYSLGRDEIDHLYPPLEILNFYQQTLSSIIQDIKKDYIFIKYKWQIFDIFVSLIASTFQYNKISLKIYTWFLKQALDDKNNQSLKNYMEDIFQDGIKSTLSLLPNLSLRSLINIILCEVIICNNHGMEFMNPDSLHKLLIISNEAYSNLALQCTLYVPLWRDYMIIKSLPQLLVQTLGKYLVIPNSRDYWNLLLVTWTKFVTNISTYRIKIDLNFNEGNCGTFHWFFQQLTRSNSFTKVLYNIREISIDYNFFNSDLTLCLLPVIQSLKESNLCFDNSKKFRVLLSIDILLFNIRVFAIDLFVPHSETPNLKFISNLLENPVIVFLISTWYILIYRSKNYDKSINQSSFEYSSVSYFIRKYTRLPTTNKNTYFLLNSEIYSIVFGIGDPFMFTGFHHLLRRILIEVCEYLRMFVNHLDSDCKHLKSIISQLYTELTELHVEMNKKILSQALSLSENVTPIIPKAVSMNYALPPLSLMNLDEPLYLYRNNREPLNTSICDNKIILPPINHNKHLDNKHKTSSVNSHNTITGRNMMILDFQLEARNDQLEVNSESSDNPSTGL